MSYCLPCFNKDYYRLEYRGTFPISVNRATLAVVGPHAAIVVRTVYRSRGGRHDRPLPPPPRRSVRSTCTISYRRDRKNTDRAPSARVRTGIIIVFDVDHCFARPLTSIKRRGNRRIDTETDPLGDREMKERERERERPARSSVHVTP